MFVKYEEKDYHYVVLMGQQSVYIPVSSDLSNLLE